MRRGAAKAKTGDRVRASALARVFVPFLALLFNLVASPLHAMESDGGRHFCSVLSAGEADSWTGGMHGAPAPARHCDACPLFMSALEPESVRIAERLSFGILSGPAARSRERVEISCPASHRSRAPPFFS